MTFLEWLLNLGGTAFLTWCGALTGGFLAAALGQDKLETLPVVLWAVVIGAFAGFVAALRVLWGVELLPWM